MEHPTLINQLRQRRDMLPAPREVRRIRRAAGVSQTRFGQELGVSLKTIQRWESGERRPGLEHMAAYIELVDQLREFIEDDVKAAS